MNRRLREDGGAVAVMTAIMAVVLLSLAALVVDLGLARDSRRQAQNTADEAALAAANALYATTAPNLNQPGDFDAAVEAAKEFAATNYGVTEGEWASCTTDQALAYVHPSSGTNCISFNAFLYPRDVLVVVPLRNTPVFFGGVVGYEGTTIGALAQARLDPGGRPVCTFCIIGDGPHNLQNGNLAVSGGNMYFNGDVTIGPNGIATSNPAEVLGDDGGTYVDGGNAYVNGTVVENSSKFQGGAGQTGQPRIVDPMAAEVLPFAMQSTLATKTNPCTDGPGIYDGYRSTQDICTLEPGLYVFTDDFELSGQAGIVAEGATMYFTCGDNGVPRPCDSPGEDGASLELSGQGGYQLSAPLKSTHPTLEEIWGFSLVFDRYNTGTMQLVGNGASYVGGTIYGVNAVLDFRGNGGSEVPFGSFVVVNTVTFSGNNATLIVDFDASKNRRLSEGQRGLVR